MRIGIDAQTVLNPALGDAAGLGHYTYQIIRYLLRTDKKNDYVIFVNYRVRDKDLEKMKKFKNVSVKRFPFSYYKSFLPVVYSETLATAFFARENLDVLHIPGGRLPMGYRRKFVATAHNLALNKSPDLFPKKELVKYRIKTPAYKRANAVIATSEAAKKDLKEFFYIDDKKVRVIYNAFDEKFFESARLEEIQEVKTRYGIDGEYILFMNTISPINNLARLIEAFSRLRMILRSEMPKSNYKLVLAGKNGWMSDEIKQIAKDFGIKNEVVFTGYIEPKDLNALFGGAELFVSVPIYEEFGATVLEAFASGLPVVCSNVTSYPEITGNAAKMVDPYDVEGMKSAILEVLRDDGLCSEMKTSGLEQAKKFRWENTAKKTLEVFEEVAGRRR
ncbi:MAG: glycosyltransferase family 1 protein [Candidatus Pacebacteria bacterium]|nr:glycosyltransferase family 1 protein [Candidatus Paceibacterota bacterium]